jgi:Archaeal putative transposase ISC1217.
LKGQVVIVDDTVDHDALGRREPLRTTGPTATCHGRFERAKLLTVVIVDLGQDVHGFPYALRKMLDL